MDEHFGLTQNVASDILKKNLCGLLRDRKTRGGISQRMHNAMVQFPQLLQKSPAIQKNVFQAAETITSMLLKWKADEWQLFTKGDAQRAALVLLHLQLGQHRSYFTIKQQPCLLEWQTVVLAKLDEASVEKGRDAVVWVDTLLHQLRGGFFLRTPFSQFQLAPFSLPVDSTSNSALGERDTPLTSLPRTACPSCGSMQSFYCSSCYIVVHPRAHSALPRVSLPFDLGIVLHPNVPRHKSTALQALLLAAPRECVHVYTFPQHMERFDPTDTIVIFPSDFEDKQAITVEELARHLRAHDTASSSASSASATSPLLPLTSLRRVLFLEGTWEEGASMALDVRLRHVVHVRLDSAQMQPVTTFWRFQQLGASFLSSIEAIHSTMKQLDQAGLLIDQQNQTRASATGAAAAASDPHRFDNLLWLFALTYERTRTYWRSHPQLLPVL